MEISKKTIKDTFVKACQMFSVPKESNPYHVHAPSNIFGFYSISGGTGVTTTIANLCAILNSTNLKIAVIDFDTHNPMLWRYLLRTYTTHWYGKVEASLGVDKDLHDKILSTNTPIVEFGNHTVFDNVTLFSFSNKLEPYQLCDIDYRVVTDILKETSKLYDIVLVDIKGDLNSEFCLNAIEQSEFIFTFIRPQISELEKVFRTNLIFENNRIAQRLTNIIQSQVKTFSYTPEDLEKFNLNLISILPYSTAIEDVTANDSIFITTDAGLDNAATVYRDAIKHIAKTIFDALKYETTEEN